MRVVLLVVMLLEFRIAIEYLDLISQHRPGGGEDATDFVRVVLLVVMLLEFRIAVELLNLISQHRAVEGGGDATNFATVPGGTSTGVLY